MMKKVYRKSIVCSLVLLGIGSQFNSITTILADEVIKETDSNDSDSSTSGDVKEISTMGTYKEALNKYNTDLTYLEKSINDINGDTDEVQGWKDSISTLKEQKVTDAVSLYENISILRKLFSEIFEYTVMDITISNGDTKLTASAVPMNENSEVKNIVLNDGSKMSLNTAEYGLPIVSSIKIFNKDGNNITDSNVSFIRSKANSEFAAAKYYGTMCASGRDGILRVVPTTDEDKKIVAEAADEKTGIPMYLTWMRDKAATEDYDTVESMLNEYETKYGDTLRMLLGDYNNPPKDETFPGPNGEIYDPSKPIGPDNPFDPNKKPEEPSKPAEPDKPATKPNNSHHHSSSNNNQDVKPVDKKTIISHNTTVLTNPNVDVSLYDNEGKIITDRALSKDSMWIADEMMTLNGVKYLRVATDEWVKLADGLEIESLNESVKTNKLTELYDFTGKAVTNRALAAKTDWYTDSSATINGQEMYRVSTNEWVLANEVEVL